MNNFDAYVTNIVYGIILLLGYNFCGIIPTILGFLTWFAIDKLAFVVDVRSNEYLKGFGKAITEIKNLGCPYRIIFLEANDQVLISRYRQTRRKHPLSAGLSLVEAIEKERSLMRGIRARATHVIDTSLITLSALREEILNIIEVEDESTMDIHIESFGFKYGIPGDSDVTCDVRFLPNPFYIPELKMLCGKDQPIIDFLEKHPETEQYYDKMMDLLCFSIPYYIRESVPCQDVTPSISARSP